jgi:small subunit ribosomal protein S16
MVKVRLSRIGGKKNAIFRVVVADSRYSRDGRFLEHIGLYDPNLDPPKVEIDRARFDYWVKVGAKPTAIVGQLVAKLPTV